MVYNEGKTKKRGCQFFVFLVTIERPVSFSPPSDLSQVPGLKWLGSGSRSQQFHSWRPPDVLEKSFKLMVTHSVLKETHAVVLSGLRLRLYSSINGR